MPLITRRSSTRGLPRTSVGSSGSIFAHCSSVSQNRLRLTVPSHMVGGQRIAVKLIRQQDYWVFTLVFVIRRSQTQARTVDGTRRLLALAERQNLSRSLVKQTELTKLSSK